MIRHKQNQKISGVAYSHGPPLPSEEECHEIIRKRLIEKWTYRSITARFGPSEELIRHIVKTYRKRRAAEAKASLMMKRRTPRRISQAHVESVSEFLKTKRLWRVTVKDIMTYIESSTNLSKLSSFSIRKILSQSLNYSYKKVDKLCNISLKQDNIRKFCESAAIQIRLEWKGIELIYIDEFSFNSRQNKFYNWSERGKKAFIETDIRSFTMSFMLGFSKKYFYGIMGTTGTGDSLMFINFINDLVLTRSEILNNNDSNFVLVMDNAAIYVSQRVSDYVKTANLSILTIAPYSPSLNPWEKLISSIKSKVKTQCGGGR